MRVQTLHCLSSLFSFQRHLSAGEILIKENVSVLEESVAIQMPPAAVAGNTAGKTRCQTATGTLYMLVKSVAVVDVHCC